MQLQYLIFMVVRGDEMISSFNKFYNNLSSDGIFFFWIIVFLFVLLLFLAIILIIKNKKLSKLVSERESNDMEDDAILRDNSVSIGIDNAIEEDNIITNTNENKKEIEKDIVSNNYKEEDTSIEREYTSLDKDNNSLYKKNVLREVNPRMQTSPINIEKEETEEYEEVTLEDIPGLNLKEDFISPLEEMEDNYEINDSMKFASDIVKQMEEEAKPSNIELTDYEKKQEEEAIISYDELQKVKDKIYNITDDEETDEFIDELKNFRLNL